jgi:DNA repair exonuclease SbcCD ATPase subunit
MAQKEFVFKINGEQAANTIAGIQEQIKKLDATIANSNINDPNFGNLIQESETAKKSLRTLQTEGVEGLKPQGAMGALKGFGKSLSEIPGPIGGVIGGINSMTAASLRFIATPVGAIIAALVVVFKAFQKGIESSEKAQMGLNKIMGAFTGIIGPVIKTIGEFAALLIDGVVAAIDAVTTALAALGIDFAENAKAGMELAGTLNAIEEAEGDLEVARAQQNKTLAQARDLLSDTNAKYEDRKKALADIKKAEEALAAKEVELAKKRVAAARETIRLYGESKENLDALDAAMIKLSNTEEAYFSKQRQFNKEQKKLDTEQAARQKEAAAAAAERSKAARERAKAEADAAAEVFKKERDLRIQTIKDETTKAAAIANAAFEDEVKRIKKDEKLKGEARKQAFENANEALRQAYQEIADKEQKQILEQQAQFNKDYVMTDEEKNAELVKAEEDKWNKLIELNDKFNQDRFDARRAQRVDEQGFLEGSIQVYVSSIVDGEKQVDEVQQDLLKRRQASIDKINAEFAKDQNDKALAALKARQESELLEIENAAKEEKYLVLSNKDATDAEKVAAEARYTETIRAEQEKQLRSQIEFLKNVAGESEESTKERNAEILKLTGQLIDNLATEYKQDEKNWSEVQAQKVLNFLEKNQEMIDGFAQATQAALDAFSALSAAAEAEDLARIDRKYAAQTEAQANELRGLEETQLAQQQKYEADVLAAQGNQEALNQIEADKQLNDYNTQNAIRLNKEATADLEYKIALEQDAVRKKNFENQKKFETANAIIGAVQSAIQAFRSLAGIPIVGPALGAIAAAAALAAGYANVKIIQAQQFQPSAIPPPVKGTAGLPPGTQTGSGGGGGGGGSKFGNGGLLMGRKHAEGGVMTSLGELEGGEFVVNRDATNKFLPTLQRINSMGSGSGAPNNLSSGAEARLGTNQPIIKTYVLASEISSQLEAQKKIADIARL